MGDFVWFDKNSSGNFDAGDFNAGPGILLNLLDENGDPVLDSNNQPITTVTDADGRYLFTNLPEGNYIVEIDASASTMVRLWKRPLWPPVQKHPAVTGISNEDVDHNASNSVGGAYRSNVIKLTAGGQPLDDDTAGIAPSNSADEDNNLTIDFAFIPPPRDYGDLPDTYGTTLSNNGASHIINSEVTWVR
ncbi:MAG: SdrD B-like domain-containing protein [Chloroflexota bacterium]